MRSLSFSFSTWLHGLNLKCLRVCSKWICHHLICCPKQFLWVKRNLMRNSFGIYVAKYINLIRQVELWFLSPLLILRLNIPLSCFFSIFRRSAKQVYTCQMTLAWHLVTSWLLKFLRVGGGDDLIVLAGSLTAENLRKQIHLQGTVHPDEVSLSCTNLLWERNALHMQSQCFKFFVLCGQNSS